MSQTAVKEQDRALIGMKSSLLKAENVLSYAAEERIPYGRYVRVGTDTTKQCLLANSVGSVADFKIGRGVALQSHARENLQDGLAPGYAETDTVSVMSKGGVYVEVEDDVTTASVVYVRHTVDAALDQLGIFAGAAGTGLEALPNARFLRPSEVIEGKKVALLELM